MRFFPSFCVFIAGSVLFGCAGGSTSSTPRDVDNNDNNYSSLASGLTTDGSIVIPNASVTRDVTPRVEISGPILPTVYKGQYVDAQKKSLYDYEGINYPEDLDGEKVLANDTSLTFSYLLEKCAPILNGNEEPEYPMIETTSLTDDALTSAIAANYANVALCAYEKYGSKPYWIPALVNHVDICGDVLGSEWRIITENDITNLTDDNYTFIQNTLAGIPDSDNFWSNFYFSLKVYIRANDNTLKIANLTPDTSPRISDLPGEVSQDAKQHLEGGYVLRCIREVD